MDSSWRWVQRSRVQVDSPIRMWDSIDAAVQVDGFGRQPMFCSGTCSPDVPFPGHKRSVSFEIFMVLKLKVTQFLPLTSYGDQNRHFK